LLHAPVFGRVAVFMKSLQQKTSRSIASIIEYLARGGDLDGIELSTARAQRVSVLRGAGDCEAH
jgi:hypothetical protein